MEEGENQLLIPCICGGHHFLDITWFKGKENLDKELYITITLWAKSLAGRIGGALEALRGGRYAGCESIVLSKKEVKKAIKALEKYLQDISST